MRKILITGGAGFVGRHFTRHFLDAGDRVIVVDPVARAGCWRRLAIVAVA